MYLRNGEFRKCKNKMLILADERSLQIELSFILHHISASDSKLKQFLPVTTRIGQHQ